MGEREGGAIESEDQFRELLNVVLKKECASVHVIIILLCYYFCLIFSLFGHLFSSFLFFLFLG